jgi:protein-tyrosine kinase
MSRFFDQTHRAQTKSRAPVAGSFDLEHVLQSVKQADSIMGEVADSRLGRCRRIELPHTSALPLISNGDIVARAAAEPYRALRTRLMRLQGQNGFRSVVISSALPGEGKTLTTLNLALTYAQLQDQLILVIDADLRTRGLTQQLGTPSGPGLAEILNGKAQFDEAVLATELPNLHVLSGGAVAASPAELFSGDHWKEFVGWASECFTIILVDSPPLLPVSDAELIMAACDGVLLVVRARSTLREQLQQSCTHIDNKKLLGLIFNATDGQGKEGYYVAYGGNHKP